MPWNIIKENTNYLLGVKVVGQSLKDSGSKIPFIVLVGPTISKSSKKLKGNRGLELKQELVKKIRSRLDGCSHLFVVRLYNERTDKLQIVRAHFPTSESSYFFFGKNRVMQLALGRTPANEYLPSLSKISPYLVGKMGLMLTNRSPQEVLEYFNQLQMEDYARAGNRVKEDVVIDEGPLDGFQHTMEPLLRSLGLTTTLKKKVLFIYLNHLHFVQMEIF